jgi:hypothetical protein
MKSYLAAAVQMTSVSDVDKNLAQAEDWTPGDKPEKLSTIE